MKSKDRATVVELEAELLRLNEMVRARRKQLARLAQCPHTDCECRQVWKQVVETKLASQVGKIRRGVNTRTANGKAASKPVSPRRSRS
jgi:hypothetical protein